MRKLSTILVLVGLLSASLLEANPKERKNEKSMLFIKELSTLISNLDAKNFEVAKTEMRKVIPVLVRDLIEESKSLNQLERGSQDYKDQIGLIKQKEKMVKKLINRQKISISFLENNTDEIIEVLKTVSVESNTLAME